MGDMPGRGNSMFYGALLLTAGSLGLRLVQLLFQIYISRIMGAAGLGRMQLIMTLGGFSTILASGGVRIAVTCLAAEEAGRDNPSGVAAAVRCCGLYGLALSLLVAALLFALSPLLAVQFVEDAAAALPLRIFAIFLPITVLWSVLAGFFTAAGRISELVGLEFLERLLSIALVVAGIRLFDAEPCTMIFLGSSLATAVSFLLLLRKYRSAAGHLPVQGFRSMFSRLLRLTIPLGLNDILRSGLSALENMLIPKGLSRGSLDSEKAIGVYGTICGMVFPAITFPSVILYSLSDLLVPEMARCKAKGREERTRFLAEKCLRLTMLYAAACAGLGLGLGGQLGSLLFSSAEAGMYIRIFSPLVLLLYLDAITDGMLKGLGQQLHSVRYNTITSILDIALLLLLLPSRGIGGFLAAFTVTHALNFYLSLRRLILVTGYLPRFTATIKASLGCLAGLMALRGLSPGESIPQIILGAALFLAVYGAAVLLSGALTRGDLIWLHGLARRKERNPAKG